MRLALAALALLFSCHTLADPVAQAEHNGVRVTLTNELCRLTSVVENLPYRVTWAEKGKTVEGCFTVVPEAGLVLAYFADKTVLPFPLQAFKRAQGA